MFLAGLGQVNSEKSLLIFSYPHTRKSQISIFLLHCVKCLTFKTPLEF